MFQILSAFIVFFSFGPTYAQSTFSIDLEPFEIEDMPGVHSFVCGTTQSGQWLILGGRIDGVHKRQPFAAFVAKDNNTKAYLIDPIIGRVQSCDLNTLPAELFEQIQSTNQSFYQRGSTLYTLGGYGRSDLRQDHITFDGLIAIDVEGLAKAIETQSAPSPHFRVIRNTAFMVAGGQMGYLDSTFYLVGGQWFEGRYNPEGPDFGPRFKQEYTNAIRRFKIVDDGLTMRMIDFSTQIDTLELHRRDYNMAPQIFPDGSKGFTAFSGVFNANDQPWLNVVDVFSDRYMPNQSFNQLLNHYHCAKMPVYDRDKNEMHTFFFGGMAQFYFDSIGRLIEDENVPSVNTVARVSRDYQNNWTEYRIKDVEMPGLLGSGAEFIHAHEVPSDHGTIDLNALPEGKNLVGYLVGGIESTMENVFFEDDDSLSFAHKKTYKVYIHKGDQLNSVDTINGDLVFDLKILNKKNRRNLKFTYYAITPGMVDLSLFDSAGNCVLKKSLQNEESGTKKERLRLKDVESGQYNFMIQNQAFTGSKIVSIR